MEKWTVSIFNEITRLFCTYNWNRVIYLSFFLFVSFSFFLFLFRTNVFLTENVKRNVKLIIDRAKRLENEVTRIQHGRWRTQWKLVGWFDSTRLPDNSCIRHSGMRWKAYNGTTNVASWIESKYVIYLSSLFFYHIKESINDIMNRLLVMYNTLQIPHNRQYRREMVNIFKKKRKCRRYFFFFFFSYISIFVCIWILPVYVRLTFRARARTRLRER